MVKFNSINYNIFFLLTLVYLSGALILNNIGFAIVGTVMICWSAITSLYLLYTRKVVNTPAIFEFFILYSVYLLLAFSFWQDRYDPKDIIATYLFFVFIPVLIVNLHYRFTSFEVALNQAIKLFFFFFSGLIYFHAIRYGIDWDRVVFFDVSFFHKNGVSAFYEIIYIFILFKNRKNSKLAIYIIIFIGLSCLFIIGSKTTFGLSLLFTVAFFSRSLFSFLSLIVLAVLIYLIFFLEDLDHSPFRTASYRALLWFQAWDEITATKTSFFLGNGPGNFVSTVKDYYLEGMLSTHNYALQIMHNYGLAGFLIFACFFRRLWKSFSMFASPAAVAFWMFNLHALFDVGWIKGTGFFASMFLGLAMINAIKQKQQQENKEVLN